MLLAGDIARARSRNVSSKREVVALMTEVRRRYTLSMNRPRFDAASFLAKDGCHAEEIPERSA